MYNRSYPSNLINQSFNAIKAVLVTGLKYAINIATAIQVREGFTISTNAIPNQVPTHQSHWRCLRKSSLYGLFLYSQFHSFLFGNSSISLWQYITTIILITIKISNILNGIFTSCYSVHRYCPRNVTGINLCKNSCISCCFKYKFLASFYIC